MRTDALGTRQIREGALALGLPGSAAVAGATGGTCNPQPNFTICAETRVDVPAYGRVLAIGTGTQYSEGGPAREKCFLSVGHWGAGGVVRPGEESVVNTSATAGNGFAITGVSDPLVEGGNPEVWLVCGREGPNHVWIDSPSIAAIGVYGTGPG